MTNPRYCAAPDVIATLARDGIGWGHDLDCGCFSPEPPRMQPGLLYRLSRLFTRRVP